VQRDVVADHVEGAVDAEVEEACCAGEAACGLGAVDDVFGDGVDELCGGEGEELVVDGVCAEAVLTQVDVEG